MKKIVLVFCILFGLNQIVAQSKTATMTTIGQDGILATKIILPPIILQNEFLNFIKQLNKSKFVLIKWRLNMNIDQYSENDISEMCQI